MDETKSLDVEMEPGDLMLLHPHLQHASWPNRNGALRMSLIAGFMLPKERYTEFEKKGAFRYLRGGLPVWSPVSDPEPLPKLPIRPDGKRPRTVA